MIELKSVLDRKEAELLFLIRTARDGDGTRDFLIDADGKCFCRRRGDGSETGIPCGDFINAFFREMMKGDTGNPASGTDLLYLARAIFPHAGMAESYSEGSGMPELDGEQAERLIDSYAFYAASVLMPILKPADYAGYGVLLRFLIAENKGERIWLDSGGFLYEEKESGTEMISPGDGRLSADGWDGYRLTENGEKLAGRIRHASKDENFDEKSLERLIYNFSVNASDDLLGAAAGEMAKRY